MSEIALQKIHVVGGGTIEPIREHLALSARAYGATARKIADMTTAEIPSMETELHLTRMADASSSIETSDDLAALAARIVGDAATKIVFWTPAVCDFRGSVGGVAGSLHGERLSSRDDDLHVDLCPSPKIVALLKKIGVNGTEPRKDIMAVACKTTTDRTPGEQYDLAARLMEENDLDVVLANDTITRLNMVLTVGGAMHHKTTDREEVVRALVELAADAADVTIKKDAGPDTYPEPMHYIRPEQYLGDWE